MKKILNLFFIMIIVLMATACADIKSKDDKLKIIVTNFPAYDFTRAVAGNNANIEVLIKPGTQMHSYDPSPKDIVNISDAAIFVYTGGDSDTNISKMLNTMDSDVTVFKMMDHVNLVEKKLFNASEMRYDEHIWTSPINAVSLVESIRDLLIEINPNNKEEYIKNAGNYIAELKKLDEDLREVVQKAKRKEVIFGDKFPFIYFTTEYDIKYSAAYPGCAPQVEPSIGAVTYLINRVKDEKIPIVFYVDGSDKKIAENISAETGVKLLLFHSAHNVSDEEYKNGTTYVDIMRDNLANLEEALN